MQEDQQDGGATLATLHPTQPIELTWRRFKNSFRYQGSHKLNLRHPTRQPETSRRYVKGDPVGKIDWKVFARTDELMIREMRDEASARVVIGIDMSDTMVWPTQETVAPLVPTKVETAIRAAFNLAHAHIKRGDFCELWIIGKGGQPLSRYRARTAADIVSQFEHMAAHKFSAEAIAAPFSPKRFAFLPADLAYWLSDGLSKADCTPFLRLGKSRTFFHTLSSLEIDFDWVKVDHCYFDESLQKKEYRGHILQEGNVFRSAFEDWVASIRLQLQASDASYFRMTEQTAINTFHAHLVSLR